MSTKPLSLEDTFIETNGIKLHCVQSGPIDGPSVLLLHGFPEFWYGWRHQISALADAGYRVLVPDQRGYNLSDKPKHVKEYTLPVLVEDICGLIKQTGHDKVYLIGHDWGAAVAWWLVMTHPELVERLVILNLPHPTVMAKALKWNLKQIRRSWYMSFFQFPWLPERAILRDASHEMNMLRKSSQAGTFTDEDLRLYRAAWMQPRAITSMVNWYRALIRHSPKLPEDPSIHVPTLILWGKKDHFLLSELALRSLEYCQHGRLQFFDQATHWVHHEMAPAINREILIFLRQSDEEKQPEGTNRDQEERSGSFSSGPTRFLKP